MEKTKIDLLRDKLNKLMDDRIKIQFEKGQAAEYNKDLRENYEYDYWVQKEINITTQIKQLTKEIEQMHQNQSTNPEN